ncbi:hypothetical protein FRB97_007457 [Tulasnella sp. 331]|nr:hypothetical protein FRB97_007457 [Tulasnella sp. 331]
MRQKRAKLYRKLMTMYQDAFGFRTPFQILCDVSFCLEVTRSGLLTASNAAKLMDKLVQGPSTLMITQCCIRELYRLGQDVPGSAVLAKSFSRRYCNHEDPLTGDQCVASVIGCENKTRYVVASQSDPLRARLRRIPGVPLIHIKRAVLVCEPPSDATMSKKTEMENASLHPKKRELPEELKADEGPPSKKRKGPKGPNPLSVKKKKVRDPMPRKTSGNESGEFVLDGAAAHELEIFAGVDDDEYSDGVKDDGETPQQTTPGVIDGSRKSRRRKRRKGGAVLSPPSFAN